MLVRRPMTIARETFGFAIDESSGGISLRCYRSSATVLGDVASVAANNATTESQ